MKKLRQCISAIMAIMLTLSLMIIPGRAEETTGLNISLVASSDSKGENPIESIKMGEQFYLVGKFSGNTAENNVCSFDMIVRYDPALLSVTYAGPPESGPCASAVCTSDVVAEKIIFANWASNNGLSTGIPPTALESGLLFVAVCEAREDINASDFAAFEILESIEDKTTFFANADRQLLEFASSGLTIPVLTPNSVLLYTNGSSVVAAPYANSYGEPQSNEISYNLIATDADCEVIDTTEGVTWSIGNSPTGITVENGTVTVSSNADAGTYSLTAQVGELSSSSSFTVTKEASVPSRLVPNEAEVNTTVDIPTGDTPYTKQISINVYDQYGAAMEGARLNWSISPSNISGVSVTDAGVITVTSGAKDDIGAGDGTEFTVTASYGSVQVEALKFTVKRAASEAASIAFYKDGSAITSDTIAVPQSGSVEATYTAQVLDQYGEVMSGETAIWAGPTGLPTNVTFDTTSGKLTVPAGENTGTGNVTLTASCGEIKGELSVSIVDLVFSGFPGAIRFAETRTYGMSWDQIITGIGADAKATLNGEEVIGTFMVDTSTKPDAGDEVEYIIRFTGEGYEGVEAYTGTIGVAKKTIEVDNSTGWLSVTPEKTYDGTDVATANSTAPYQFTGIEGTDDIGTVSVSAKYDSKDAGENKTITVNVTVTNDNYTVKPYTETGIIYKALITEPTFEAGNISKEYDGTTAPPDEIWVKVNTFNGKIGNEDVGIAATASHYASADVGESISLYVNLALTGNDASNYELADTQSNIMGAITAKDISENREPESQNVVVGVGEFTAPSFTGVNGESVSGSVTYTYNDEIKSEVDIVAALKELNVGATTSIGYTFMPTDGGNYTGKITGTINVTMVDILFTVNSETANAKNALDIDTDAVYGDTWADIVTIKSGINATLNGNPVEGTYQLSVNTIDSPTAGDHSFELQFVSNGKTYKVCDATVNVTKREVSISGGLSVTSKVYDGNTTADVTGTATLSNVFGTDDVSLTYNGGTFDSQNAGTHNVTLTGAALTGTASANYTLSGNYTLTGTINKRAVTVTGGLSVTGKEYDGYTNAVIVNNAIFDNVVTNESLTLTFTGANFASADVGTHDVTLTGVALGGDYAANYELTGNLPALSGTISKATYSPAPSLNINIVTNQAAAQTGTLTALNFFGGSTPADATITNVDTAKGTVIESISAESGVLSYSSKTGLPTKGVEESYNVTITTKNYNDITATLTFTTVDKTPVTISGVSVANKVYNGQEAAYTGTAVASVDGKAVEVSGFTFTWKDSDGKVLGSAPVNAGSYTLEIAVADSDPRYVGTAPAINFTIATATVTITVDDKSAFVGEDMPEFTYTVSGLAAGESLAVSPAITCSADMDEQGEYAITAAGAAVPATGNYNSEIVYVNGILTVSRRPVNVGPTYDIEIANSENGSVDASLSNASEGSVITLTVTPDDGYKLGSITVTDENGDEVSVRRSGNSYRFTMPDSAVRVSARFVRDTGALPFNDVNMGDWFYDYVEYVYENGIMDGVDSGVFSPNTATTRGMVVTILYRLAGEPTVRGGNDFADVAENTWYTDPVAWASNAGIVNGTSATTFSPDAPVTREQFAAMLYRYMDYIGEDVSASANLSRYADASSVSPYAEGAMSWAVAEGIINGRTTTTLEPAGNCTRAEVAAMIARVFG